MAERERPGPIVMFRLASSSSSFAYIKLADISAVTTVPMKADQSQAVVHLVGGQELTVATSPNDVYGLIVSELYTGD